MDRPPLPPTFARSIGFAKSPELCTGDRFRETIGTGTGRFRENARGSVLRFRENTEGVYD
jgi:hypothetical protein